MTDQRDTYLPFDQRKHLDDPPWRPTDPAVQAWEAGHGHDVRLKCYVEFGCQAIENALEAVVAERDALRDAIRNFADTVQEHGTGWDLPKPIAIAYQQLLEVWAAALAGTPEDRTDG